MRIPLFVCAALVGAWLAVSPRLSRAEDRPNDAVHRESGVIAIDGVSHPYLIEGQGESCIFVGPAPGYPRFFSDRLKRSIRFIFVDFKRTWNADPDKDTRSVTMEMLLDEVDAVRKAFNLQKACLIAHSGAGLLAIEYSIRHPESTSKLILVAVPAVGRDSYKDSLAQLWETDASPERKAVLAENIRRVPDSVLATLSPRDAFAVRYARTGPYYFYNPRYDVFWALVGYQFSPELATRFYREITASYQPWDHLTNNRVPMFVAIGRYDYILPVSVWSGIPERIPLVDVTLFKKSGHFPMFEEQDRFDSALTLWLKRPSTRAH
jgi:proline iminopeptidase